MIAARRRIKRGRRGRAVPGVSVSPLPTTPLKFRPPLRVVIAAGRQGGRSNDASSVNQAISFLRDRNEDLAETAIDFPFPAAVARLSQVSREKRKTSKSRSSRSSHVSRTNPRSRSRGKENNRVSKKNWI